MIEINEKNKKSPQRKRRYQGDSNGNLGTEEQNNLNKNSIEGPNRRMVKEWVKWKTQMTQFDKQKPKTEKKKKKVNRAQGPIGLYY